MTKERTTSSPFIVVFSRRLDPMIPALDQHPIEEAGGKLVAQSLWTEDEIIKNASEADAIVLGAVEPFNARVLRELRRCKLVSRRGVGYDNVDIASATKEGIAVAYVPDASVAEVSDHALALLLALSRCLVPLNTAVKAGHWRRDSPVIPSLRPTTPRLSTQTLGLVGIGRIGLSLAMKAKALGLRIIAFDPYASKETASRHNIALVSFEELLRASDFISIHTPLTPETHNLFSHAQFRVMKPSAYIINTARGGIINEEALIAALQQKLIAGAGLDVTEREPLDLDSPLLTMDNVILTGHSAAYSGTSSKELARRSIEAVVAVMQGRVPMNLANPEVLRQPNCRLQSNVGASQPRVVSE